MEEFMGQVGSALAEMRLIIEGMIALYEEILPQAYQKARMERKASEAATLDTMEGALYSLKDHICDLQAEHQKTMSQV